MNSRPTNLPAARSRRRLRKTFASYDGAGRLEDCGIGGVFLKLPVRGAGFLSLPPLPVSVLTPLLHLLPLFFFFGFLDSEVRTDVIQAAREDVALWGWVKVASHNGSGVPAALHTGTARECRLGVDHHGREERVLTFFGSNCGLLYTFQPSTNNSHGPHVSHVHLFQCFNSLFILYRNLSPFN